MKKLIITLLTICIVFFGFAFLILFEASTDNAFKWWASYSRNSPSLPYSPYKIRREDAAFFRMEEANSVEFIDKHIFWKGAGAVALPEVTKSGKLVKLIMQSGGEGYSEDVKAVVKGSMGNEFKLGKVFVEDGEIKGVEIEKTSFWHFNPKGFWGDEELPYSGTIEKLFPNGQVMFEKQFLAGLLHGKWNMFEKNGLKKFSKDYDQGKKQGTHIYYFDEPLQPDGYVYEKDGVKMPGTLWLEANEKAKEKYGKKFGTPESNQHVIKLFKAKQGFQQVKL
jgi:hypothetical protein